MSSVVDSSARTPSAADRRYAHLGGVPYAARDGARLSRPKKALIALAALAVLLVVVVPPSVTLTRKHNEEGTLAQAAEIGYTTVIAGTSTFIQTRTASIVTRSAVSTNTDGRVSTFIERVTLPLVTVSATALESAVQPHFETVTVNGEVIIEATSTSFIPAAGAAVVTRTDLAAPEVVATVVQTSYADVTVIGSSTATSSPTESTTTSAIDVSTTTSSTTSLSPTTTSESSTSVVVPPTSSTTDATTTTTTTSTTTLSTTSTTRSSSLESSTTSSSSTTTTTTTPESPTVATTTSSRTTSVTTSSSTTSFAFPTCLPGLPDFLGGCPESTTRSTTTTRTNFNDRQTLHSRSAARTWRLPSLNNYYPRVDHNTCLGYDNFNPLTSVYPGPAGQTRRVSHDDNDNNAGSLVDNDFRAHTNDYDALYQQQYLVDIRIDSHSLGHHLSSDLHPWLACPPRRLPASEDHVYFRREYSDSYEYPDSYQYSDSYKDDGRKHSDCGHPFYHYRLHPGLARPPGRLSARNVHKYFTTEYSDSYLPFTDYAAGSLHSRVASNSRRLPGGGRGVFNYHQQYHDNAHARISGDRFHHEQRLLHSRRSRVARRLRHYFFHHLNTHVKRDRDV